MDFIAAVIPPIKAVENPENIQKHIERFAKVRERIGDGVDLAIDFHGRVSPAAANVLIEKIKPYSPMFIEEPCLPENVDCMVNIAHKTTVLLRREKGCSESGSTENLLKNKR